MYPKRSELSTIHLAVNRGRSEVVLLKMTLWCLGVNIQLPTPLASAMALTFHKKVHTLMSVFRASSGFVVKVILPM
jgi:hypothetical protein